MSRIIILILVIGVILGTIFYHLQVQQIKNNSSSQGFIFTFEECVQSKGKVSSTFPRQCEANDGKTYIEKVIEPVSTDNWQTFNTGLGFSFKCPPSWNCQNENENSARINQGHYLNISVFHLERITPQNFQKSFLRHPNYKTPIDWLKDLQAKQDLAIKVLPETIRPGKPGTDQMIPPSYYYFNFDKMIELETKSGKALVFPGGGSNPDTSVVIPLNSTDVVLVILSPEYLYQDPIVNAIVSSVSP